MARPISKDRILARLNRVMPQPERIVVVDMDANAESIDFNWRGIDFNVSTALEVTEAYGQHGHGMLIQALLQEAA